MCIYTYTYPDEYLILSRCPTNTEKPCDFYVHPAYYKDVLI